MGWLRKWRGDGGMSVRGCVEMSRLLGELSGTRDVRKQRGGGGIYNVLARESGNLGRIFLLVCFKRTPDPKGATRSMHPRLFTLCAESNIVSLVNQLSEQGMNCTDNLYLYNWTSPPNPTGRLGCCPCLSGTCGRIAMTWYNLPMPCGPRSTSLFHPLSILLTVSVKWLFVL